MRAPRFALPATLAAVPFLFFHEVCLGGRTYLLRDLFNWFYPWRRFAADSFARGEFPLWNPYSYAGIPFFADMQSGLLYPPNLVFFLLDFAGALRWFLVIQFALASGFMYLLLRACDCRPVSSIVGALGYAYGGWMIVHIEFPNKLSAAAWLPLILLGLTRWWRGRPARGLLIGALATACCVAAGYPQTTYTLLLGAGVIWCGALVAAARSGEGGIGSTWLSMPAVAGLGALIAAAQIVPFLEAWSLSAARPPFEPAQVLGLSLSPWHFLDLVSPHLFGLPGYRRYWGGTLFQYWLGHFYVGALTLVLAFLGAFSRRAGAIRCAALLALAVLFCLGDRTPLAPLCIAWLPGFDHFKWLSTTSVLIAFALCWLAALGLDRLLDDLEGLRRLPRWVIAAGLTAAAAAVAIGAAARWLPERFDALARAAILHVAMPVQIPLIARNPGPARDDAVRLALIAALAGVAFIACRAGRLKPARFAWFVALVSFLDLKGAASGVNFAGDPSVYRWTPPRVADLMARPDPLFRVYVPDDTLGRDRIMYGSENDRDFLWAADTLLFDLNLPWRLFSASDGDPIVTARWKSFHRLLEREGHDDVRGRLLAVANIGVVLKADAAGAVDAIEVPAYLPRVHVAAGARRVAAGTALEEMLSPEWDPRREVLVEDDFPGETRPPSDEPVEHTVRRVAYTDNTVTIEVSASARCYLVLADAAYPGWKATLDAAPAPIFTADHLFRGIDLPAGDHVVRFGYRPASVLWGAAGSALGLALAGLVLLRASRDGSAVVGAPVVSPAASEQTEHRHEDGRTHDCIDGRKRRAAAEIDLQKRGEVELPGDPAAQRRADEAQRDGAETSDRVRAPADAGSHGAADGSHHQKQEPEQRRRHQ